MRLHTNKKQSDKDVLTAFRRLKVNVEPPCLNKKAWGFYYKAYYNSATHRILKLKKSILLLIRLSF